MPDKTPQEQVRQLQHHVNDLVELLRSQRDILKRQGMSLPAEAMDSLRSLKVKVDGLMRYVGANLEELNRLQKLEDTAALINSSQETDVVLRQVMDTVIDLTGAERGYIVLKNRKTGEMDEFRVVVGMDDGLLGVGSMSDEPDDTKRQYIVSHTVVNDVARTGKAVLTDNASQDERYSEQKSIVSYALRSILAVPLKVRGEIIGVVYCDNRIMAGLFQERDLELLTAFANQAAVAIENARLFEESRAQLLQITEMRDLRNSIFTSIISGVITINTDGVVITCNAAAMKMLEIDPAAGAIGQPLEDILPPLPDEFYNAIYDVFNQNEQEKLVLTPQLNGKERYWNVIISPLQGGQGVVFVLDDLTQQRARESQLKEVRRYLPLALVENVHNVDVSGEERIITMIATDVRGFTSFSERLQPEELMTIINQYLSVASDAINLYEGIVDKYMGDAVTGLFNTQLNPQSDHALRGVRAAMSIMYDLHALHEILPEEQHLYYGIGVHTGPAYLGNVGGLVRQEFSALGEAATISKLLESNAARGEVLISEATYRYVADMFEVERRELTEEQTKGYDLPVAYKVVGRKKGRATGALFLDPELAELLRGDD